MKHICMSGGADGADLQFGMCAGQLGHTVVHWSFPGHRTEAPVNEVVVLSDEQLREADPALIRANQTIRRRFPTKSHHTNSLLRRNYFQIRDTQRVYAVGQFKGPVIDGGTAWAVQMFIDRHDGQACPIYFYDQNRSAWLTWTGNAWEPITDLPQPCDVYTGIGSRDLRPNGKQAIRTLMNYQPG